MNKAITALTIGLFVIRWAPADITTSGLTPLSEFAPDEYVGMTGLDFAAPLWQTYAGAHDVQVNFKSIDPPVQPPPKPKPPTFWDWLLDTLLGEAINMVVPVTYVLASGPVVEPDPGSGPFLHSFLPGTVLSDAVLTTELGLQFPMTVTPISNLLTDVPTSMTTVSGTFDLTWDLDDYVLPDQMEGTYFLFRADIRVGDLIVPEPATALLGLALIGGLLRRARRGRR